MTFSILGRCPKTGMLGMAVSSSSPCVAARCAHARAGAGVVASQNITDPRLGPKGLDLMAADVSAEDALLELLDGYPTAAYRQIGMIDAKGGKAWHSGGKTLGIHAVAQGERCLALGNLLAQEGVPQAMAAGFEADSGESLADHLLAAMTAALEAGGEEGPVRSAGLVLVEGVAWPVADLRIDWSAGDPIAELAALWELWRPQLRDYVTRALDPSTAPAYGVPGDA
ncbi:MAG: DUF1028 domain-containing protein [Rhodovibrionaceae bacterium]